MSPASRSPSRCVASTTTNTNHWQNDNSIKLSVWWQWSTFINQPHEFWCHIHFNDTHVLCRLSIFVTQMISACHGIPVQLANPQAVDHVNYIPSSGTDPIQRCLPRQRSVVTQALAWNSESIEKQLCPESFSSHTDNTLYLQYLIIPHNLSYHSIYLNYLNCFSSEVLFSSTLLLSTNLGLVN